MKRKFIEVEEWIRKYEDFVKDKNLKFIVSEEKVIELVEELVRRLIVE